MTARRLAPRAPAARLLRGRGVRQYGPASDQLPGCRSTGWPPTPSGCSASFGRHSTKEAASTTTGAILVLGATGKQGGAVARHLLDRGRRVRTLVRDPTQSKAAELARRGAELIQTNLDDPASLHRAVAGASGVFCVLAYQPDQPEVEARQGTAVGNAAAAAGVGHLVYSSAAGAHRGIGVRETDSKWAIEQHLATLNLRVTVLRPTFLMENFDIPDLKHAIQGGSLYFAMRADTRLQMIASDDVGALAALAFDDPDAFAAPTELAGDELPMTEIAATFARVLGGPIQYVAMPYESAAQFGPNLATLGAWLDREGYQADIAALRRLHPAFLPWKPGCTAAIGRPTGLELRQAPDPGLLRSRRPGGRHQASPEHAGRMPRRRSPVRNSGVNRCTHRKTVM